jgi:hypothetical protein
MTDNVPQDLGIGLNSIGLKQRGAAILLPGNFEPDHVFNDFTDLTYIDSYQSLFQSLNVDVQASFTGFTGQANASASFARSSNLSSLGVYMLVRRYHPTYRYTLREPTFTDTAKDVLSKSTDSFLTTYGDLFTRAITFGGALYLFIQIQANSDAEAQEMRLTASGSAGPIQGSGELTQKLNSITKDNRLSVRAFTVGVINEAPEQRPDQQSIYEYIDTIFAFLNNFDDKLLPGFGKDHLGAELVYESASYDIVEGGSAKTRKLDPLRQTIQKCLAVRDEANRRRDIWNYAFANPQIYQNKIPEEAETALTKLRESVRNLEEYVVEVYDDPADKLESQPPEAITDLPALPTPVPIINIPMQITVRGVNWQDRSHAPLLPVFNLSSAQGKMLRLPASTTGQGVVYSPICQIDIAPVTFDLDLSVICHARTFVTRSSGGSRGWDLIGITLPAAPGKRYPVGNCGNEGGDFSGDTRMNTGAIQTGTPFSGSGLCLCFR